MLSHAAGPILAGTLAGCVPPNTSGATSCVIGVTSCATGVTLSASGATSSASGVASKASGASVASAVSTAASVGFAPGGGLPALPAALVDSIRKGEFVDLKDLLPENVFEAFISAGDKDKEKKKKKISIETFQDWALAYTTWASTIIAASPSRGLELLQYLGVIGRLARDNPPHVWLHYDKQFRQMAAAAPQSTKWDELQFQFLQWAKQSQPAPSLREPCRRWNEGRYCQFSSCKRDHSCSICGRSHRAIACSSSRAAPYPPPRGAWAPRPGTAPLPVSTPANIC